MSWEKIENHLFDKYCVEGEDRELQRLMEEHDREIHEQINIDSIKLEELVFIVHTRQDEFDTHSEYRFSNKNEFLKFMNGEYAIDKYGNTVYKYYEEYIEQAYIRSDIDIMALYKRDIEQENDLNER